MKGKLRDILLLLCFSTGITVILESKSEPVLEIDEDNGSFQSTLGACLAKKIYSTFECINRGTLSVLQTLNNEDVLDYDSLKLERAEGQNRDLFDLDYDSKDFGNVVQAAARLMERRNLKWDLGNVYPGLQMRVGPMLNGNGVLEFVVDERYNGHSDRQLGTGLPGFSTCLQAAARSRPSPFNAPKRKAHRNINITNSNDCTQESPASFSPFLEVTGRMLVRSLVLPLLLGFKFSLASLIPLIFGVLLLVTKKALLLTKFAMLLSGILGWNSITTGGYPGYQGYPPSPINSLAQGLGAFGLQNSYNYENFAGGHGGLANQDHYYHPQRPFYKEIQKSPDFPTYGQHIVREVVNVYDSEKDPDGHGSRRDGKNFVWST